MELFTEQFTRRRLVGLLIVLALAFFVRGLTANFIGAHLDDAGWFQFGSYANFDARAQGIVDGRESLFWLDDATRTDNAIYPPGYAWWVAVVYAAGGVRAAAAVQAVQWLLDSLSVLLVAGIGVTAFGWRVGIWAGILAALSPLLATHGATPMADAPTSWFVLAATWMLVLAATRASWRFALAAGLLVGASCWLRPNAMLLVLWWMPVLMLAPMFEWRVRSRLAACVLLGAAIILSPIVVRNIVTFQAFVPTGLGVGTNLWEGIGETERAAEFGAVYGDAELLEQERRELNVPPDAEFTLYYPDGVERDAARRQKALAVIAAHPVWYAGVMAGRMAGVLKFAGEPSGIYGTSGINVTSTKCLPAEWQGGVVGFFVTALGMVQSVLRHIALPLMLAGIFFAFRRDGRLALIILSTVLYYLIVGSFMHIEIRYTLAMQAVLFVFAGFGLCSVLSVFRRQTVITN